MPHSWWKNLSDGAKNKIILDAKEKYDKAGRTICYWCGSILKLDEAYDLTSNSKPNDLYKICKGYCRQRRFFDEPTNNDKEV